MDPSITTHLARLLAAGGRNEALQLVMRLYRDPLTAYVQGVRWSAGLRSLPGCETPQSIVDGFFAQRLSSERVLASWVAERCRFRAWIRATMRNYLLSLVAIQQQDRVNVRNLEARSTSIDSETDGPEAAFDRAYRVSLVREAMRVAGSKAAALGRDRAWRAFMAHELHGTPYAELVDLLPGTHGQRAAALRRMRSLLVEALRDAVAWPGATEVEIDEELEVLMGAPSDRRGSRRSSGGEGGNVESRGGDA